MTELDEEDYGDTDIGCSSISIPSYHRGMGNLVDLPQKKEEHSNIEVHTDEKGQDSE